jgi:hypothetical protein
MILFGLLTLAHFFNLPSSGKGLRSLKEVVRGLVYIERTKLGGKESTLCALQISWQRLIIANDS